MVRARLIQSAREPVRGRVEFASGEMVDITDTDGTGGTVSLAGDVRGLSTIGARFCVRQHRTLASVFGALNEAGCGAYG